jgi:predicted phage-related endonuclease
MSNRADFEPNIRNAAWWATDSRRSVSGGLVDVILEKKGKKELADLSNVEAVQMGHVMQPVIGRLFAEQTGIAVREHDDAHTHRSEVWLRAHTDFITDDGGLLEVKNFHSSQINNYPEMDDEQPTLPAPDYTQCLHEATVFDVPHVWFAVLFGGQRFRYWKICFNDDQKDQFRQQAAKWWSYVHSDAMPDPETPEQARLVYPVSNARSVTANARVIEAVNQLRAIKQNLKTLEDAESTLTAQLQAYMADAEEIVDLTGASLVTWKQAKGSKRFDAKSFETAMPDLYESFKREMPGSRRFLIKGDK